MFWNWNNAHSSSGSISTRGHHGNAQLYSNFRKRRRGVHSAMSGVWTWPVQMASFNFFRDEAYFGKPRQMGTSHLIFNTPWQGDPRINIQEDKGKAKAYQVRQVLLAIDKLEGMKNER